MRDAFEERVNDIDRRKQSEKDEEGAMVRVIMRLVINGKIDIAFPRKKQQGRQIQDCWRDQDEDEEKKRPRLLVAPPVENPPSDYEVEEEVNYPDGVHPVNAAARACLQHFADTAQHSRHAQGEND